MFTHEKLIVYQRAVEWMSHTTIILKDLPTGNGELASQLKRATLSILLNIAEVAGRVSKPDKRRFFAIARGSALECAAILDALSALALIQLDVISAAKDRLHEIVSMLSSLARN